MLQFVPALPPVLVAQEVAGEASWGAAGSAALGLACAPVRALLVNCSWGVAWLDPATVALFWPVAALVATTTGLASIGLLPATGVEGPLAGTALSATVAVGATAVLVATWLAVVWTAVDVAAVLVVAAALTAVFIFVLAVDAVLAAAAEVL